MKPKRAAALAAACLILCAALSGCSSVLPFEGSDLESGKVGIAYEASIATGTKDMYYDLDYDSVLPAGLILYDDGAIRGVPKESGVFPFKAVMIDLNDREYYADFTLDIAAGEISYTGGTLADGTAGEPYSQSVATATGMTDIVYTVKEGTRLPAGLSLSKDGVLSGIPAEAGAASVTVAAAAGGCESVEAAFTFTLTQGEQRTEDLGRIVFEDFTLPDGLVGREYSESVRTAYGVAGITYSFRFPSGQGLPAGLKSDKELGLVSGTPADSTTGPITFKVTASAEGCESVTASVTLTVCDPEVKTTRFETEYVDSVPTLSGAGYSSAPSGRGMIQSMPGMSNGYALGYLNKPETVTFHINSAAATSATLVLGLGSEVGDFTYDPSMFSITVNGSEVDYGAISVKQTGSSEGDYESRACTVSPAVDLIEGENVISFSIKESPKATGTFSAVGCLFDYIELTGAGCDLSWRPRTANITA